MTAYHTHPFAVAAAVPDELKPAALLHDVLEDTPILLAQLRQMGFSKRTINAVWMVTRYKGNPYDNYVQVLMQSDDAVIIKIADMEHNLSCEPSKNSKVKIAKWLPALKARAATIRPNEKLSEGGPDGSDSSGATPALR